MSEKLSEESKEYIKSREGEILKQNGILLFMFLLFY